MNYIKPDKSKHLYILGFDFGHGETSVDKCDIQWNATYSQLGSPESIEIFNGVPAIKSVVLVEKKKTFQNREQKETPMFGMPDTGETVYIGQQAVSHYGNPKNHTDDVDMSYFSYFKKRPSDMSDEDKKVMRTFMHEVYEQIKKQRQELKDDNHLVYIACPSNAKKWTEKELEEYAQIALEAGLPLAKIDDNIGIIRESRAAFLKAISNPKYKSSIIEGLLLIDFGSSTVDLTYYSSRFTDKPIDGGDECGASHVEERIAEDMKMKFSSVLKSMEEVSSAETAILLNIRDSKEYFYTWNSEDMEISLPLRKYTKGLIKESADYFYSDDEIKGLLSDYIKSIKEAFVSYRDTYLKRMPVKLIFLTGGASRMDFIQQIAREVFAYDGDFYKETNPSLTISNGIALAGRADLRTCSMEDVLLKSDVINKADIATNTIEKTASYIAERVITLTSECYKSFADKSYDDDLESLENDIKRKIDSIDAGSYLTYAYNEVLKDITNNRIIPTINDIVRDYFPSFEIENITSSEHFSLSVNSDNISTISSVISSSLNKIEEGLIEGLGKLLWNVAAGGIVAVESVAANIGIGLINIFRDNPIDYVDVGDVVDEVTISFRDKHTKLSSSRRNDVKKAFCDNVSTYKSSICSDIKYKLKSESSLINQINIKGRDDIKTYIRKQIKSARIMLN